MDGLEDVFRPKTTEEETWHVEGLEKVFEPQPNTAHSREEERKIKEPFFKKCNCSQNCRADIWVCPYFKNHWGNLNPNRVSEVKMFRHLQRCHDRYYKN